MYTLHVCKLYLLAHGEYCENIFIARRKNITMTEALTAKRCSGYNPTQVIDYDHFLIDLNDSETRKYAANG